jgi:hypothetical protein
MSTTENQQTDATVHPSTQFLASESIGDRSRLFFGGRGTNVTAIDLIDNTLSAPVDLGFALYEQEVTACFIFGDLLVSHSADSEATSIYSLSRHTHLHTFDRTLVAFPVPFTGQIGIIQDRFGQPLTVSLHSAVSPTHKIDITDSFADLALDDPSQACIFWETPSICYLAIGCYGYCELITLSFLDEISRTNRRTLSEGFVYDPLTMFAGSSRTTIVNHGYGCGMAAIDLVAGTMMHCPRPPDTKLGYGVFHYALGDLRRTDYWVTTQKGCFSWTPGKEFNQLPDRFKYAVYRDSDIFVSLDEGRMSVEEI